VSDRRAGLKELLQRAIWSSGDHDAVAVLRIPAEHPLVVGLTS
jgi:hypothetical protein